MVGKAALWALAFSQPRNLLWLHRSLSHSTPSSPAPRLTPTSPHLPAPSFCSHRSWGKLPVVGVGGVHCFGNGCWAAPCDHLSRMPGCDTQPHPPAHSLLWLQAQRFPAQPERGLGIFPWFLLLIYCVFPGTIWGWEPGSNNAASL